MYQKPLLIQDVIGAIPSITPPHNPPDIYLSPPPLDLDVYTSIFELTQTDKGSKSCV